MNASEKKTVLLFELNNLQVYGYQIMEDIEAGKVITEVFWQDNKQGVAQGPFPSIYAATKSYADFCQQMLNNKHESLRANNVIFVDFKAKKRIG